MTRPARAILDTSVFIANESGRTIDAERLPDESAISVVTVAELQVGVLAAVDSETRAARLATLDLARDIEVLPAEERVALAWARLRVHLAEVGRRANVNDLWIAATAVAHGLPVVTQDMDFDPLEGALGLVIIRL
ncbi:MAG TPA: type II toxin-antitoxin system VapC family toxin [Candidatus Dormibacteraeota bacterium]|nr:type II toxin-antitoxin system VapC family toxin [Candidatus Dormibacteraeota bacterium]